MVLGDVVNAQLAIALAAAAGAALLMIMSGMQVGLLEQRKQRRVCRACGRELSGRICDACRGGQG